MPATVNVWSQIVSLADGNSSHAETCREIVDLCSGAKTNFANEFTFTVSDTGVWSFHLFNCFAEGEGTEITIDVLSDGRISVRRSSNRGDGIHEERKLSF